MLAFFFRKFMKSKALLFTGILLLILGILFRKMTQWDVYGLSLIIIGVICKSIYIIQKVRNGTYKPGKELILLVLGLLLFLTGLYLRDMKQVLVYPIYFIVLGITLKIFFIVRFIQIVRAAK
jgi:uncharacterized membrane protein